PNNQALIKYKYSMLALDKMGYSAVGIGENEAALSLLDVLAEFALQPDARTRVVTANLMDAGKNFPQMTVPWQLAEPAGTNIKVGITSVTGPAVATRIRELTARSAQPLRFSNTPVALDDVVSGMAARKVHLPVLLYQGPMTRNDMKRPPTEGIA